MTETSMFWADGIGDGGPYSQDQLRLLYDALAGAEDANRGVFISQGNELDPSSTGNNNIRLAIGRAVVDGTLYENDAILDIVTASPVIGTTGRRCVLQKDWAARTVRAAIITSADGVGAIPALTQNDGTIWEIPICSFTITTGGVIGALTDEREFCEGTDSRAITILDRDLGQVDIASDDTEQSIYSFSIPARALGVDGGVLLKLAGDMLVNLAGTIIFRVKLGATTMLVSDAINPTDFAQRYKWTMEILLMNLTASSQKVSLAGDFANSTPSLASTVGAGTGKLLLDGYGTAAEDTIGALTLDVTVEWSVISANLSFRKEIALLELLPPA